MDRGLASLAAVPGAKRAWLAASNGNKAMHTILVTESVPEILTCPEKLFKSKAE